MLSAVPLQQFHQCEVITVIHHHIADDQVRFFRNGNVVRRSAVIRLDELTFNVLKRAYDGRSNVGIIIDNQYLLHCPAP